MAQIYARRGQVYLPVRALTDSQDKFGKRIVGDLHQLNFNELSDELFKNERYLCFGTPRQGLKPSEITFVDAEIEQFEYVQDIPGDYRANPVQMQRAATMLRVVYETLILRASRAVDAQNGRKQGVISFNVTGMREDRPFAAKVTSKVHPCIKTHFESLEARASTHPC